MASTATSKIEKLQPHDDAEQASQAYQPSAILDF